MSDTPLTSKPYQYRPLAGQGTIRLLKLEWSNDAAAAAVRGSLDVANLEDAPGFEALSYCWGQRSANEPVIYIEAQPLKVTTDLHCALLRLRQREEPIWIDAICINQEDIMERTQQVRQMHRIYASASLVIVWLGEASPADIRGFAFADDLLSQFKTYVHEQKVGRSAGGIQPTNIDAADIATYAQDFVDPFLVRAVQQMTGGLPAPTVRPGMELIPGGFFKYYTIFAKDWFIRTWVVQEICLARHVLVKCGAIEIPFDEFYDARQIVECGGLEQYAGMIPEAESAILGSQAMDSFSLLRNNRLYGTELLGAKNLISRVIQFGHSFATDPRDKVFALVGLTAPEDVPDVLQPNYSPENCFSKVCLNMARYYLSEGDPLALGAVLSCPNCPFEFLELPSWVADLRQLSCRIAQVCITFQEMRAFSASADTLLVSRSSCDGEKLQVRGCRFDVISSLGDYGARTTALDLFETQIRPPQWYSGAPDAGTWKSEADHATLKIAEMRSVVDEYYKSLYTKALETTAVQAMYVTGESLTEAFWRTMCCNRDFESNAKDNYSASRPGTTRVVANDGHEPFPAMGALILGYFRIDGPVLPDAQTASTMVYLGPMTKGRNWCISEGGYMGWVPFATKLGDEIAIIEGQAAPFVIRPVGDGNHRLIGECYIHGVMKGEIVLAEDYEAEEICLM